MTSVNSVNTGKLIIRNVRKNIVTIHSRFKIINTSRPRDLK